MFPVQFSSDGCQLAVGKVSDGATHHLMSGGQQRLADQTSLLVMNAALRWTKKPWMFHIQYKHKHYTFSLLVVGLRSLLNIWGHIATVPACSSDTLTNVLPHRNAMPQTQGMTSHPVTVYRHRADLSLCYPLMWNITQEYTATHFNVLLLGKTQQGHILWVAWLTSIMCTYLYFGTR